MPFIEEIRGKMQLITDSILQSMSTATCGGGYAGADTCRDDAAAFRLKMAAIFAILVAGVAGVSLPLVGKKRRFLQTDSNLFVTAKAFAGGVILATGFVHMLPDATSALTDRCLPKFPWSKFPFAEFVAMIAALATLLADFVATQYYERKANPDGMDRVVDRVDPDEEYQGLSDTGIEEVSVGGGGSMVSGAGSMVSGGGSMHIVGIHAHAAQHRHSHSHGGEGCEEHLLVKEHGHGHGHSHGFGGDGDDVDEDGVRHVVISQILELGIVSHSVIIGLSLGVSHSPCTIRSLLGALSFHQFFEGFALGGCISQAQFGTLHATVMACFFAITTPVGIAVGAGISSFYNPNSPRALIIEGVFDSISAGILIYMALVDLIAADFLSKRMSCNVRLQIVSYFTLFLGAGFMSSLAIWA